MYFCTVALFSRVDICIKKPINVEVWKCNVNSVSNPVELRHASQPTYQSTNKRYQPINHATNQPINQPLYQPTTLPTNHSQPTLPTTLPTNHSTNQPLYQQTLPTKLPTNQQLYQPTNQSTTLPTNQSTNQPTYQPTTLPTNHSTNTRYQPNYQPTTTLPTNHPINHSTNQPIYQSTYLPTNNYTNQPTDLPTTLLTNQPILIPTKQTNKLSRAAPLKSKQTSLYNIYIYMIMSEMQGGEWGKRKTTKKHPTLHFKLAPSRLAKGESKYAQVNISMTRKNIPQKFPLVIVCSLI